MPGHARTAYFACDAHQHPLDMFLEIWREYSPAAQIKRQAKEGLTYSKLGTNSPP
jgi:transposase-like protein